jgi:hypothetical protein
MLYPRLTNCIDNTKVSVLMKDIDCKLTELANNEYNNVVFALNYPAPAPLIDDLLNYKRILRYKYCNVDYAPCYSIEQIASRVKVLINK